MEKKSDIKQLNIELFEAVLLGDNSATIKLLNQGAEINSRHILNATPLFAAVTYNKAAIVQLLLAKGADLELTINSGPTPLYKSAHSCHPKITKLLIENGADKEVVVNGYTALYAAISSGCLQDTKILLAADALTHSDYQKATPILIATQERNANFVHQQIYNLVIQDYWQELETALPKLTNNLDSSSTFQVVVVRYKEDLAWLNKEFKHEKIIIYNKGANDLNNLPLNSEVIEIPNVGWFGGSILYHLANKYEALADRTLFLQGEPYDQHLFLPLIRYKENIDSKCKNIIAKCVESSLLKQSTDIVEIAEEDWEVSKYGGGKFKLFTNYSMIDFAHQYIDKDLAPQAPLGMVWGAQFAVDKAKVYLHKQEFYQKMLALFNKQYPMEDFFLEKLWDPIFQLKNITKLNEQLFDAAIIGDNDAIIKLLSQGAEINSRHTVEATSLLAAATTNHTSTAKLLIDMGAELDLPINNGETPLHKASLNCNVDLIKTLVEMGANIAAFTYPNGHTPLYMTVYSKCLKGAEIILEAGATSHSDATENTALRFAKYLENRDFASKEIFNLVMDYYWKELAITVPKLNSSLTADTSKTFEVVVVRYNEDLEWLKHEFKNEKIIIYNKGEDDLENLPVHSKVINIPNIGWFGGSILYHLVNNYNILADRTLFLQGEPYEQPLFLPLIRHKGEIKSACQTQNIIGKGEETTLQIRSDEFTYGHTEEEWATTKYAGKFKLFNNYSMIDFAQQYVDKDILLEGPLCVVWGAQFAVDKSNVYLHKAEFYQRMLPLFEQKYPMADFYLEKLWDIIFQPETLDEPNNKLFKTKYNNIDINKATSNNITFNLEYNMNIKTLSTIVGTESKIDLPNKKRIVSLPNDLVFIIDTRDNIEEFHDLSSGQGHEPHMIEKMMNFTQIGETYVEVGSHYGDFALRMSQKVGPSGMIYGFEPNKNLYQCFSTSVFLNGITNIVSENLAVLDKSQKIGFFENTAVTLMSNVATVDDEYDQTIMATSLDDYFKDKETNLSIIRVDAEGSECRILRGAKNIIDSTPNIKLFIEWQPELLNKYETNATLQECLTSLIDRGFVLLDALEFNKNCNYKNYQLAISEIMSYPVLEVLAIKENTLKDFIRANPLNNQAKECLIRFGDLLYSSVLRNNIENVKFYLAQGADIDHIHKVGATSLYWAAQEGKFEIAKILIDAGADLEIKAINNMTPLTMSVQNHDFNMIKLLIDAGANIETSNGSGATSLYLAAYFGYDDIITLLLENGANKNVSFHNITAFETALAHEHYESARLLADDMSTFCIAVPEMVVQEKYAELCGKIEIDSIG